MECDVCMEPFNSDARRPKILPCGHTFCLRCMLRQDKRCPVDRKAFRAAAVKLPDNYKLLEMCQRPAAIYGWCRCCESEAVEACLDKHPSNICSLAKARSEKLQPQIDKLDAAHAALGHLGQVLDSVEQALPGALCECRTQLEQEAGRVEAKRSLLQAAMTTDPMQWIKAETKDKDDDGGQVPAVPLGEAAASLLTDLTNPATTCSLTVTRHAGPGQQGASAAATWPAGPRVAWRGSVPPRDDPAARLLLCRLLCRGGLRPDTAESLNGAPAAGSGSWTESGNEVEMTGRDMARLMAVGSRVARGLDWHPHWQADGTPPGQGSVVAVLTEGGGPPRFCVRWDATLVPAGASATDPRYALPYSMEPGCFHLALLPNMPQAMVDSSGPGVHNLSITSSQAATTKKLPALTVLSNARTVVGLRCDVNPNWSKKVLHQVAGTVEVLSLISAQQQHLKVCRGMARLRLLHLCGSPVLVEPLVDLTVDPPAAGPGCSGGVPIKPDPDPVEEAGEKAPLPTALRELHIFNATQEQLLQIPKLTALRRLELHCPFTSPLPPMTFPAAAAPAGLQWLRLGIYPLRTALALLQAHAATLEELELVAASKDPYGCPDLAAALRDCGVSRLQRLVLWRGTAAGKFCQHAAGECLQQKAALRSALSAAGPADAAHPLEVSCSECDAAEVAAAAAAARLALAEPRTPGHALAST